MAQEAPLQDPTAGLGTGSTQADAINNNTQTEANGSVPAPSNGISADEIALYDRQIRLWGMKAQEKIRNANILLITMRALANEIAKNLVLAGIGSITILDSAVVTPADLGAQFLLSEGDNPVGTNRAAAAAAALQRLNPRVRVHVDTIDVRLKPPSFFAPFDVVIATDLDSDTLNIINTATRLNNRPFYAAGSHGMHGFLFADLIEHDFVISRAKANVPTPLGPETRTRSVLAVSPKPGDEARTELVTKRELYSTWYLATGASQLPAEILRSPRRRRAVTPYLSCLRALWEFTALNGGQPPQRDNRAHLAQFTRLCTEQHRALGLPADTLRSEALRSFLQDVGGEIAPVAAVLGGQLAQDVINVLGQTQQPLQNLVVFDGDAMEASVYALHPDGDLGRALLPLSAGGVGAAAAAAAAAGGGGVEAPAGVEAVGVGPVS
ncbi:8a9ead5a-ce1c-4879-93ed-7ad7d5dc2f55 [Thermothielavioides terrestris]|uniref:Ubiquitin-like 1-activating enzyme E1A n=1 Tax=Thermothielavioides terrestris TaxID=2587410 RepID=A0A3S4EZ33_9PEZI|nr:8a9ead5a-ce1c-4879-93ed-7ad7d5dc2f55 [Thermothielavioides terrestris]